MAPSSQLGLSRAAAAADGGLPLGDRRARSLRSSAEADRSRAAGRGGDEAPPRPKWRGEGIWQQAFALVVCSRALVVVRARRRLARPAADAVPPPRRGRGCDGLPPAAAAARWFRRPSAPPRPRPRRPPRDRGSVILPRPRFCRPPRARPQRPCARSDSCARAIRVAVTLSGSERPSLRV